jgi:glucokinase
MRVVGVDLGGTKVAAASLEGTHVGESLVRATDLSSSGGLIDQLVELVEDLRTSSLKGVGIGVPSVVDFESGRVISSVNIPLADIPLRQVLGERLGVPVFVDNDATVAALAEAHDLELRLVARNLVMLTVGTGIGGGLVLGGRIYRGATGGAGELGHTLVALDLASAAPAPTSFPQPGSLEWVAAGHALDRLALQTASHSPGSALGRMLAAGHEVLGADAVAAAHEGDADAIRAVEAWAEHVGIGVANAINTFDPDEVVLGGGAALAGELLLQPAARVARGYVVPGLGERTTIRLARHGVRAGVLGAALLAVHELEEASAGSTRDPAARPAAPESDARRATREQPTTEVS